jgi:hypothetical protein
MRKIVSWALAVKVSKVAQRRLPLLHHTLPGHRMSEESITNFTMITMFTNMI